MKLISISSLLLLAAPFVTGIPTKEESEIGSARGLNLRILALGDSITFGSGSTDGNGYRLDLLKELSGNTVIYVGSKSLGHFRDDNYEGHSGYTINEISGQASKSLPSRPNVVLLHAGTNDLNRPASPAGAPERLGRLIDKILKSCPDAVVLVAKIIPSKRPVVQDRIKTFNAKIVEVAAQHAEAGKHVLLVDMFGSLTHADLRDDFHPNNGGYKKMADKWYQAIEQAHEKGWIKNPVSIRRRGLHAPQSPHRIQHEQHVFD
ncbi:hypothetical protein MMC22_000821 [Lobaria immixta]|nr:hypothetical protein [Lobaria immixta]